METNRTKPRKKYISSDITNKNNITLMNRFTPLSFQKVNNDDHESFDNDNYDKADDNINYTSFQDTTHSPSNRCYVNKFPERDNITYNSKSSGMFNNNNESSKSEKKVCVFSDSICNRMNMREFNKSLINKNVFKRCFSGANTTELQHYVVPTLDFHPSDIVILNIGSNNLKRDKPVTIADDIMNLIDLCKRHGVNQVIVSGITPRKGYQSKINELNNLLENRQREFDFTFVNNNNIITEHLWRDKVHLNDTGMRILTSNFISMLNGELFNERYIR